MENKHSHILLWVLSGLSAISISYLIYNSNKSNKTIQDQDSKIKDLTDRLAKVEAKKVLIKP